MKKNTNSRNFRAKLSEYLDKATESPISISRGDDRLILMNESDYLDLKDEVMSLQKNLIAMLQVNAGRTESSDSAQEGFNSLFKQLEEEKSTKKTKNKKEAG